MSARALLERVDQELLLRRAAPEVPWASGAREAFAFASLDAAGPDGTHRLRPRDYAPLAPALVHSLAVIEARRFLAIDARADDATATDSAESVVRAWSALGARTEYLVELARRMSVPATLSALEELVGRRGVDRVREAVLARVDAGRDLGPLLRALLRVSSDASLPAAVRMLADRARVDAIEALLGPLAAVFDDLRARAASEAELVTLFGRVHDAWKRSDRDLELEILTVERIPDFAWDFYREKRFTELARVLVPTIEPVLSLASRIERGESAVAWAAPCAQALVFRAELADRFDQQVELAERAFGLCPSLRNARVVLGDFLLTRAERALDRGNARTSKGTLPEEDVERAASLYPELRRLSSVRSKLATQRGGAS